MRDVKQSQISHVVQHYIYVKGKSSLGQSLSKVEIGMAARNHSVTSGPHEKSDPLGRSLDKYEPDVTIIKIAIKIIIIAILKNSSLEGHSTNLSDSCHRRN